MAFCFTFSKHESPLMLCICSSCFSNAQEVKAKGSRLVQTRAKSKAFAELLLSRRRADNPDDELLNPTTPEVKPDICPCGSKREFSACCGVFHRGEDEPADAVTLLKARFSAYARGDAQYVLRTTHKDHPDLVPGVDKLTADIQSSCDKLKFLRLDILDTEQTTEDNVTVSFKVTYSTTRSSRMGVKKFVFEKSRFVREEGKWLYIEEIRTP